MLMQNESVWLADYLSAIVKILCSIVIINIYCISIPLSPQVGTMAFITLMGRLIN